MQVLPTKIRDVLIIEPKVSPDERGFFMEAFHKQRYAEAGIDIPFIQDNHSGSKKGVLRGLHYQIEHPQGKLVRVVRGAVYDVAVDLRKSSPTFGQYVGEVLSEDNCRQLWVPPGFAHGFYVLTDWAEFIYKVTDIYFPEGERIILWDDPDLDIAWPREVQDEVFLTPRDTQGVPFRDAEYFD
ncbi:dTDP-4-dehydrorhamnose 3,5-epimerase [bacterium]|nr:dTDP-4-dehydrorhamnose 3,5-epimerase [bacterium]MCB2179269.1 dTDP-4-dehydrorhamnose 3,5-epimerase [bacterium]